MQEILFRGKIHSCDEWIYGTPYIHPITQKVYIVKHNYHSHAIPSFGTAGCPQFYEVIPKTVGQYISLLEAYEGDVLWGSEHDEYGSLLSSWFGFIKYDDSTGRIRIQDDLGDWYEIDDFDYDKIIGNIYDNPELIV